MMTFDAAEVLKVPWEIVAKKFRTSLGKKVFNSLDEYAAEFFYSSAIARGYSLHPSKRTYSYKQRGRQQWAVCLECRFNLPHSRMLMRP
jgi:hypothetical protein